MNNLKKYLALSCHVSLGLLLSACVTVEKPTEGDPLESYNRTMFKVNEGVDKAVLRPIAKGYEAVVPQSARRCVSHMFSNVGDVWSGANSLFQGRGVDFINSLGRFLMNSTIGLGGCYDVAGEKGAKKIENDFGTTLGVWGIGDGPYVVLPLFGSSSLRDMAGMAGDSVGATAIYTTPWAIDKIPLRNSIVGVQIVNKRANLLAADDIATDVSLDKYAFVRDAYKQSRQALLRSKLEDEITSGPPSTAYLAEDITESGLVVPGQEQRNAYRLKLKEKRQKRAEALGAGNVPAYEDPGE